DIACAEIGGCHRGILPLPRKSCANAIEREKWSPHHAGGCRSSAVATATKRRHFDLLSEMHCQQADSALNLYWAADRAFRATRPKIFLELLQRAPARACPWRCRCWEQVSPSNLHSAFCRGHRSLLAPTVGMRRRQADRQYRSQH